MPDQKVLEKTSPFGLPYGWVAVWEVLPVVGTVSQEEVSDSVEVDLEVLAVAVLVVVVRVVVGNNDKLTRSTYVNN